MRSLRAAATRPMARPRRSPTRRWVALTRVWPCWRAVPSTAAHRTRREPCLVMWPRRTLLSDSRCFGVRPAQLVRCRAEWNRVTSPISATKMAASVAPTPGIAWIRLEPPVVDDEVVDAELRGGDLFGQVIDEAAQRVDAVPERGADRGLGQQMAALDPEQVVLLLLLHGSLLPLPCESRRARTQRTLRLR